MPRLVRSTSLCGSVVWATIREAEAGKAGRKRCPCPTHASFVVPWSLVSELLPFFGCARGFVVECKEMLTRLRCNLLLRVYNNIMDNKLEKIVRKVDKKFWTCCGRAVFPMKKDWIAGVAATS